MATVQGLQRSLRLKFVMSGMDFTSVIEWKPPRAKPGLLAHTLGICTSRLMAMLVHQSGPVCRCACWSGAKYRDLTVSSGRWILSAYSKPLEHTKQQFQEKGFRCLYSPYLAGRGAVQERAHHAPELRSLVNNPEFADVVFVLDDGRRVHGMKGTGLCPAAFSRI